jgi:hypothetical protein
MSLWIHLKILELHNFNHKKSFLESLNVTNEILTSAGLPSYRYPNELDTTNIDLPEIDTSRSGLEQLKYVAAMLLEDINWIPSSEFNQFSSNQIPTYLREKIKIEKISHLIWNDYGNYIPVDFGETSLSPEFLRLIGSSINLKNEMESLASKLKLNLTEYTCNIDGVINSMMDELEDDPLFMSKIMMIRFYNVVLASIKYNLIICMD